MPTPASVLATPVVGRNPEITWDGWYTLINALYHVRSEVGEAFFFDVKDTALGHRDALTSR